MSQEELELLNQLDEEIAVQLLSIEWKSNGGRFNYHKGSPRRMNPTTDEGNLFLTLANKLRKLEEITIEQVRFYFCSHKVEKMFG